MQVIPPTGVYGVRSSVMNLSMRAVVSSQVGEAEVGCFPFPTQDEARVMLIEMSLMSASAGHTSKNEKSACHSHHSDRVARRVTEARSVPRGLFGEKTVLYGCGRVDKAFVGA